MARTRRWVGGLAGMLLVVSVGVSAESAAVAVAPGAALNDVGRALAQALDSPSERAWLRAAMDASPYVEHRVRLRQVLTTRPGATPSRAILDRAGFGAAEAVTMAALPDLELYLAIATQRQAWRGETGIDVAVRQPDDSYVIYSAAGSPRAVPAGYDPAARITLTLAASEIDYTDSATALRGGPLTGDSMLQRAAPTSSTGNAALLCTGKKCPTPPPPPPPPVGGDTTLHTQMDVLYLANPHDDPLGGTNEIEIFGNVNGGYSDCGRITDIQAGYNYVIPARYPNTTLARAVPLPNYRFKLHAYEDDSGACVFNTSDDNLGAWTTGILRTQYGIGYRTESPGDLGLSVRAVTPFE